MMNKEIIKEFLKPDWRKIGISIILFLFLSSIIPTCICYNISGAMGCECADLLFMLPKKVCTGEIISALSEFAFVYIFSYILSCLIIFIYGKFRKRK